MTNEEYMKMERERNVKAFAHKFISEHHKECGNGNYNYSDENLAKTFKDCALPLRSIFYNECRNEIDKIINSRNF